MTAIEYLRQYEIVSRKITRLDAELENERLMYDSVRSLSDLDGLPHGTNISRPVEERAIRIVDKYTELVAAKLEAIEVRQEVFETVMSINAKDSLACDVLLERYIYLKPWKDVCEAVRYTWPTVRKAWHRGLELIELKINTRSYIE